MQVWSRKLNKSERESRSCFLFAIFYIFFLSRLLQRTDANNHASFAYILGTKCKAIKPTWEKLAHLYSEEDNIVVGSVNCDDNKDLCSDNGVQGFPTLLFFSGSESTKFEGGRSLDDLVKFVNEKTGLDLASDGGVAEHAGVIHELKEHIKSYVKTATEAERSEVLNTCTEKVKGMGESANANFKYYLKVFGKIAEQGVGYVKKEKDRLSKLLHSSDKLKQTQKRSFLRRMNVLNSFDNSEL